MNPDASAVAALGDGPAAPPFTAAAGIGGIGIGAVEFTAIPAAFIRSLCRWIISRTRGCAASLGSNPMSSSWCLRKISTVSDLRAASCSCCWRIACTRAGCSEVISAGISVAPTAASARTPNMQRLCHRDWHWWLELLQSCNRWGASLAHS